MSQRTIFDDIVDGTVKAWKVWEDDNYLAFLTPFPNTPGVTVVIPKQNIGSYVFNLSDQQYQDLLTATKKVANVLQKAFSVEKVGLVFEGHIPYVHAKLYPMHGGAESESLEPVFHKEYPGYIETKEGPKMDDSELDAIQKQILEAQI